MKYRSEATPIPGRPVLDLLEDWGEPKGLRGLGRRIICRIEGHYRMSPPNGPSICLFCRKSMS